MEQLKNNLKKFTLRELKQEVLKVKKYFQVSKLRRAEVEHVILSYHRLFQHLLNKKKVDTKPKTKKVTKPRTKEQELDNALDLHAEQIKQNEPRRFKMVEVKKTKPSSKSNAPIMKKILVNESKNKKKVITKPRTKEQELDNALDLHAEQIKQNEPKKVQPQTNIRSLVYFGAGWDFKPLSNAQFDKINNFIFIDAQPRLSHYEPGQRGYKKSKNFVKTIKDGAEQKGYIFKSMKGNLLTFEKRK